MNRVNISNKVFRLKHDEKMTLNGQETTFPSGTEFHIVGDVLYMGGHLIPPYLQKPLIDFVMNNMRLFIEDTRNF
jgi:hypothetical protein